MISVLNPICVHSTKKIEFVKAEFLGDGSSALFWGRTYDKSSYIAINLFEFIPKAHLKMLLF